MNGTYQGLIQSNPEKPKNCKETGLNWNKLDQQGGIDLPKYGPNTHLPLGASVNHDYWIEHQRAPLSHC